MRHSPRFLSASIIALVLLVGSIRTRAQEDTSKPKPAAREFQPLLVGYGDQDANSDQQSATNLNPDTQPLTGVQTPTIGSPELRHSYWMPGFQYGNFVRSSALNQSTSSGWNSTSYVAGNLSLLEAWNRSQLSVNYSGGGSFSTDKSQGNDYYHQLGLVQAFNWQRWQVSFIDQFTYLPQSQFGFGAATNLATPGVGGPLGPSLPGLQTNYQPNQTIFTSIGPRYSNSITTQVVYAVGPRGSVTLSGSYGTLRFVQAGNIDTNDSIFSTGYNYALSQKDTIGVLYRFSGYRYIGAPQAINDHVAQLAYGRKITGRLALQLFGGPEVTTFRVPFGSSTNKISGSGGGNLTYALSRSSLSLTYNHGISGGGGQFTGSTTDQLQGAINHQLSRVWQGNVTFGFARNTSLGLSNPSQVSQTYDSWFIGGGLSRPLGRTANFTFAYTAYLQNSRLAVCAAGTCGTSYIQHQISLGFQWHTRPLVLR
jgi:hypothetical protein